MARRALIVALALAAAPARADRITIATVAPDGSAWMREARQMVRDVREFSGGRLDLHWIPNGIAGEEKELASAMAEGRLDGAAMSSIGLGRLAHELRVFQLPYTLLTTAEIDAFRARADADLAAALERKGFVPIVWVEVGFQRFFSRRPIRTLEDLRGKRVWRWEGDDVHEAILAALGARAVKGQLGDIPVLAHAGQIDAAVLTPITSIAFRAFPEFRYVCDLPVNFLHGGVVVSQRALDRLDDAERRVLRSVGQKYEQRFHRIGRLEDENAARVLRAQGLTFVPVEKTARSRFFELGRRFRAEAPDALIPRSWIDRVMAVLGDVRAR